MLVAGILAGAGLGLGLLLVIGGLLTRPRPLADALADLRPDPHTRPSTSAPRSLTHRLAERLDGVMTDAGLGTEDLDRDLRVVERTRARHALHRLAAGATGMLLPVGIAVVMRLGGVSAPPALIVLGSLGLGAGGLVLPDRLLRTEANERRRSFRFALSSYLDLVTVLLAAGAGVETALADAAATGHGWAYRQLHAAIDRSRLSGATPWEEFHRTGVAIDVPELRELAASLDLAGTHGARVRTSLRSRSGSLRTRQLSETEAYAEAATERMSVPTVVLVVGFILFVGFPSASQILGF